MRKLIALLIPALLSACLVSDPLLDTNGEEGEIATIFTRNLYLGGDISPLLGAPNPVAAAGQIWYDIQNSNYPARAARVAREIAENSPDLVGLQEVVRFTVGSYPSESFPETELLDFLKVLQNELAALGREYIVVARQPNTRVALPLMLNGQLSMIGYEDATAILVKSGTQTANAQGNRFQAAPPVELTAGIPFSRGWTQVDALVAGGWVRFVNAHLEIQSFAPIQTAQAQELIGTLSDSPYPVILVGDLNSAANPSAPADRKTGSYGMFIGAGFEDLWAKTGSADDGLTCCHLPDLSNGSTSFNQRLDLVLARNGKGRPSGFTGSAELRILGRSVEDRFTDQRGVSLWPSDHAGVLATVQVGAQFFSAN